MKFSHTAELETWTLEKKGHNYNKHYYKRYMVIVKYPINLSLVKREFLWKASVEDISDSKPDYRRSKYMTERRFFLFGFDQDFSSKF